MTIADELIARVDADRARENNQGSVIKEIIDRVDADRGPGFLTGTKDVLASAAIGLGNIPKAVTQIGEMATSGSPIFAQGTQAIDNAMNWLRERLVSDETLAQQRQIARTIANDDAAWYDVISQAFRNPAGALTQGAESLSSFAVPAGAGAGAVRGVSALSRALKPTSNIVARTLASVDPRRAQMAALLGTNALMNAGETFSESQGQDIADRYQGAGVSGVASLIGSALTGGAAERTLSNMILRDVLKGGIRERVAGVAKDAAKEGVQEFIEEGGNAVGSNVAKNEDINIGQALRQGAYGALLGAGTGGALGSVNALTAPAPRENSQAQVQATPQQTPSSQQAATQAAAQIGQIAQAARAQAQPQPVAEATPQPAPVQQEVTQETTPVPEATPEPTANDNQRVILQNRNRSSDASIQQMNAIAAQPDYLRVAESHDFGNGAPVVAYGQVAPNQLGKRSMSVTSDGERIPVQYAVVEAVDVLTSNQVNGSTNAEYESAPATRIRAIAGNGRVAGLAEAYRRGTADQYRAELREDAGNLGIAPEVIDGMNAPILVRVMPTDRVRADIGDVSNTSGNLALNAVETAANDVNRINFDKIVFNENGEPDVDTVIGFVRQMPISEQGALIDTNGQPTRAAHERFANALFKKAYGDDELVRLTAQAVDPEIRNVIAALSRVAPKMARLEGLGDLDIRGLVKEAAQVVVNAHRQGVSLAKFAAQGDATIDPDAFVIVQCFAKNARSVKEMARVLELAADFAYSEGTKDDVDMFGEVQRAMRQDVLNRIEEETNGRQKQTAAGSSEARTEAANNRNQFPGPQNLAESTGAEPAQENVQRRADRASADGRGSADAQRTEEAFELTGQTEAEAQAEAARIQEITDTEQREQQEAERRQREERIAREERQAADRSRDDFTLADDTVSADDAVSGQQGLMFSRSAQSWHPDNELIEKAVENFGLTNDIREAFYVLPDGRMLDGSGRHWGGDERSVAGQRQVDHSDISEVIDDASGAEATYEWMGRTGAMRFDQIIGIASVARPPTKAQLDVLNRANRGKYLALSLNTPEGRIVDDVEFDRASAAKINAFFEQALEKAARGVAGPFASVRRGDRGNSESVQALRRSLSEDKQLGDAFDRLQDHGVVDVVDSAQDAFARMAMARPASVEASLSEIPAGEGPARQRVKKIIEQQFPEGAELEVRVDSDQSTIIVGRSGFRHSAFGQRASNETLVATMHAPELIQKSVSDGVRRDKAGKVLNEGEPGGAYVYFSRIDIDGTPHLVRITVKPVSERRGRYYDMKAKKSASGQIGWSGSDTLQDTSEASDPSVSEEPIQIKRSDAGDIQAIYDPETGKSYLIAENIKAGDEKGVLVHEVGVHMAADRGGREAMRPLVIRAQQIVFNGNANGDATAKHVYQRLKNADLLNSRGFIKPGFEEEAFAYLAEEMVNSKDKASSPIREWFEKLLSAVRVWLYKRGLFVAAENLSDRDLVSIAVENVRTMARQGNGLQNQSSGSGETVMNSRQDSQDKNAVPVDEVVQSRLNEGNGVWGWIRKSDGIGGHKFGAGEWAYNHLANATRAVFDAIDRASGNNFNLNMASKEFRQAFRRYRADVDNARSDIANAAQAMQSMSEEERRLVSDVIEKMVAPGVNPSESVLQVAASIQNLMDAQTDELVRLGLLTAESAERWRGQYLPRVYLKQTELFEEAKKNFRKIFGSGEGLRGGHLKGRGIFRTVVGNQAIAQHKALGWEIRDPNWNDAQGELQFTGEGAEPRTPTVVMWRDFTPQERAQMGECRDAMVRLVLGYMQTQEDIALARFFDSLSRDSRFAASVPSEDWVRVPDTSIGNGSNVKRFGALAGMYVAPDVWSEIQHLKGDSSSSGRLARTMLAAWKEGKTALNPVAHTNNTVGNITLAYFAGVNALDPRTYMRAFQDIRSNSAMFQEAQRAGLLSGNFSRTEMLEMIPIDEVRNKLTGMKPGYEKIIDAFMEISSLGLRKKLRSAYETEDTVFKYIIYKHARENGMSVEDAVDYAGHYIFNYDDLPSGARRIRDSLLPFFSWTYKAVPTLLYTAMVYPHRYLAPMAMVFAVNKAAYLAIAAASSAGGDDWEDIFEKAAKLEDAEREALPEYAQGRSIFLTQKMIRTWNNSDGTANFLDMSRLLPGGDLIDVNNQMGGMPWMQTLMPNSPQLGLFMALFANKDPFTGREVVDDTASFGEAFRKRLGYFYKNIAPAIAPGGYHVSRLADGIAAATGTTLTIDPVMDITGTDWNGRKMELSRALAHTFGIKMRSFNWDQEVRRKTQKMAGEISDKRRQVNYSAKAAYRGAVSPEAYRNFVRRTVEDVKERADKLQKFREKVKPLLPEKPRP